MYLEIRNTGRWPGRTWNLSWSRFTQDELKFFHTYKKEVARYPAFLDDYAYLIQALIHLQEITGNAEYLYKAKSLTEWVIEQFSEEDTGYFFYTNKGQQDVIVRKKEVYDGAVPSGNAIMAFNLQYLGVVFDMYRLEGEGPLKCAQGYNRLCIAIRVRLAYGQP